MTDDDATGKWSVTSEENAAAFVRKLRPLGTGMLRYGLVCLLLFWGGLKFASSKPRRYNRCSPIRRCSPGCSRYSA